MLFAVAIVLTAASLLLVALVPVLLVLGAELMAVVEHVADVAAIVIGAGAGIVPLDLVCGR